MVADLAGDQIVITRHDLHLYPMAFEGPDGGFRRVLRRIEKGHVTVEDQIALIGPRVRA